MATELAVHGHPRVGTATRREHPGAGGSRVGSSHVTSLGQTGYWVERIRNGSRWSRSFAAIPIRWRCSKAKGRIAVLNADTAEAGAD